MEKLYNGWTNYATWRINLECIDGFDVSGYFEETPDGFELAKFLENYVIDELIIGGNELAESYALAFIADVNWIEIAEHLLDS
jgi:hypothetical protein